MKNLAFGLGRVVPDDVEAAWGGRFIITMDGHVDLPLDRTSAVGDDDAKARLLSKLDATFPSEMLYRVIKSKLLARELDTRVARDVVLFDDDGLKVVANTNASAGYLYVAAWATTGLSKLYNVTARSVGLVWADDADEAFDKFKDRLEAKGFEVMPDGNGETVSVSAFVSEPVEAMAWAGE